MATGPPHPGEGEETTYVAEHIGRLGHICVVGRHTAEHSIGPVGILTGLLVILTQVLPPTAGVYGIVLHKVFPLKGGCKIYHSEQQECKHRKGVGV